MLFSEIICRICSFATAIKNTPFDKNCHIWILTKKELFFTKNTNYFTLPTGIKRCRNLLRQNNHPIHPHLGNNPYPEVHPRSYGECPWTSCLQVDYPYIFLRSSSISGFMLLISWNNTEPVFRYLRAWFRYLWRLQKLVPKESVSMVTVLLQSIQHFKREWRRYFALFILVVTNRLYREFRFLHSYIGDVWFWQ